MIAGSLLLLILPLAMAGIVYVLSRWTALSALLSAGTALLLGAMVIGLPLGPTQIQGREIAMDEAVTLLGRELILDQADRTAMAFLFFATAAIFILAWRFTPQTLLFPMGLGLLSLLCGALLIRPLVYAALFIEIAVALSVFALQPEGKAPTRGGLRYLIFTTLALPCLLVTHWLLERYTITPDETELLTIAAALLALSFALLVGIVPFHTWIPALVSDSVPLAATFVLTVANGAAWFLLLDFLEIYPSLSTHVQFSTLVPTAGVTMAIVGGLLAPAQRRLGPLMGYAALADTGATLIALGLNTRQGMALVFLSLFVRPLGLMLMATGLSGLQERSDGDDSLEALRGLGWRAPWSTAALVLGALSIAGLPISAGFACRWALYRELALTTGQGAALFLLLAGVGVMAGTWKALGSLLVRARAPKDRSVFPMGTSERRLTIAVIAAAIVATIGIGLFPQILAAPAARVADTYTFFVP